MLGIAQVVGRFATPEDATLDRRRCLLSEGSYQRPYRLTSAHERDVMEVTVSELLAKKFHAMQHASTMAS